MRFFTPELYVRFNSADEEEADRANEAWETAIQDYERHLDGLRDRMPSQIKKLTELCLHDSELLALNEEMEPLMPFPFEPFLFERFGPIPFWSALAVTSLKQDDKILTLFYVLWDRIREHSRPQDWPFSGLRKHWLYDEVDVATDSRRGFLHRVLFSDGSVIEIPFVSVITHGFSLPPSGAENTSKKIA
jgi:hypothetical protein